MVFRVSQKNRKAASFGGNRSQLIPLLIVYATTIVPTIALCSGIALILCGMAPNALETSVFLSGWVMTSLGVTLGLHRLFSHRSFKCGTNFRYIIGVLASASAQGPVLFWVATHRKHHQYSDSLGDPHSPKPIHENQGHRSLRKIVNAFLHSHMTWMLKSHVADYRRYCPDLLKDSVARNVHRYYFVWVAVGVVLPGLMCWAITGSMAGLWSGVFWGGLVRIGFVHHCTWSVNSICHVWGSRPFQTEDGSRNNGLCNIFAFGEGWHNNHHAFPSSARFGHKWWQMDIGYSVLRAFSWLGLVWDVKIHSHDYAQ
jgi:stearoyl-CoA desaturase (Delta-9 desaturase)